MKCVYLYIQTSQSIFEKRDIFNEKEICDKFEIHYASQLQAQNRGNVFDAWRIPKAG